MEKKAFERVPMRDYRPDPIPSSLPRYIGLHRVYFTWIECLHMIGLNALVRSSDIEANITATLVGNPRRGRMVARSTALRRCIS